jgi:hypothetical protein
LGEGWGEGLLGVDPIDGFVFECHSPFTEHKKIASLLSQALIPNPSPKREKGEKLMVGRGLIRKESYVQTSRPQ